MKTKSSSCPFWSKRDKIPAQNKLTINTRELFSEYADSHSATRFEFQAMRELQHYKSRNLQVSTQFWPKLMLSCDGQVLETYTAFTLTDTPLCLVVKTDVTACKEIQIGPGENADAEGKNDEELSLLS